MIKTSLFILVFILLSFFTTGQIAELKVNKKHSVEIKPCTSNGSTEIPEGYYQTGDTIYFIMTPRGDWEFSKGDLKNFRAIRIKQSENSFPATGINSINEYLVASNKIEKILISFEKKNIILTDQFEFILEEFTSDIMELPENLWPYYNEFNRYYNLGKQLNEEQKYIEAFQQLKNILPGQEHASEYIRFSNYKRACDMLIPEAVTEYQKKQSARLQNLWADFEDNKQVTTGQLEFIKANRDSLIITDSIFNPYYRIQEPKITDLKNKHNKLINDYNDLYNSEYRVWKKSVLNTIENGNYDNKNKYEVFIELLARLLVYTNRVEKLSKYDSLDISLISRHSKKVSFLKKQIDILEKMGWKSDFITIAKLLNEEIKVNSHLIGQTHLLNLKGNKEFETQPNYYIINGFNELVKGNPATFKDNINLAIAKCTDLEMMYYLELWNFSYRFKMNDTDEKLIEKINKGLEYQKKGMPKEALENYEIADRIGNCALPPFLIGLINLKIKNNIFSADRYLHESINIYPNFTLANIYILKILIDSKQYNVALNNIEDLLKLPELSTWYIYYLQSKLLYINQDYEASLQVIQTKCRPLNPYIFEQYIMLGDIYLKQNNCIAAKEYYQDAGDIEPDNKTYSVRMQMMISQCN